MTVWSREVFWSGTMLLSPDTVVFKRMVSLLDKIPSYDGADQGFFNSFFHEHWRQQIAQPLSQHVIPPDMLPAAYTLMKIQRTSKFLESSMVGVDFAGANKPWMRQKKKLPRLIIEFHRYWWSHMEKTINISTAHVSLFEQKILNFLRERRQLNCTCY